jgi:hypothetical protein
VLVLAFQGKMSAQPPPPVTIVPEVVSVLFEEDFDEYDVLGITNEQLFISGLGTLDASWSGYALQRSGDGLTPFVVPGLDTAGRTNFISGGAGGAFRFWVDPRWSTAAGGPGYEAQLLQLVAAGTGPSILVWSLQTTADGSALQLVEQSDSGPVTLFSSGVN